MDGDRDMNRDAELSGPQTFAPDKVVRVVNSIHDRAMALGYVRDVLRAVTTQERADLLETIHGAAIARDHDAAEAWLLMGVALATDETLTRGLRATLEERGANDLARILLATEVREMDNAAQMVPDFGKGRPLSLGERKSLARGWDRSLLQRVMRDPSPDVVRMVLANPRIVEADVIRLAARRPVLPSVLSEIFVCVRWITRGPVRVALSKNPYLPLTFALRLVPTLGAVEQRAIEQSPELAHHLREACTHALSQRVVH